MYSMWSSSLNELLVGVLCTLYILSIFIMTALNNVHVLLLQILLELCKRYYTPMWMWNLESCYIYEYLKSCQRKIFDPLDEIFKCHVAYIYVISCFYVMCVVVLLKVDVYIKKKDNKYNILVEFKVHFIHYSLTSYI